MPASITPPDTARPVLPGAPPDRHSAPASEAANSSTGAGFRVPSGSPHWYDGLRRFGDVVISFAALALLAPLFVVVAAMIKISSPGPVFYHQVRVGLDRRRRHRRATAAAAEGDRRRSDRRSGAGHGQPFLIYKFRTMVQNAEEYGPQWSSKKDPRIFPVGRLLRMTRLDETPQFLNVLKGDMSLIGPRPERPYFVDQFAESIPRYRERLRVRPGITGRAQVSLEYDSSVDDVKRKLEQDLLYIQHRSPLHDLGILFRTVWVVVTGRGAC